MKRILLTTVVLAIFLLSQYGVFAQSRSCGNGHINLDAVKKAMAFEKQERQANRQNNANAYANVMRVYFHVFRNDDGSQAAATEAQINIEFANLLSYYTPDGLCFQFMGTEFINSTTINQNFNADNDKKGTALATYLAPGCLNIFYLTTIGGNNTACTPACSYGGITLDIPDTFTLISSGNINDGVTVAHEVGHAFGLLHTFEKSNGFEDIDESNGSTSADLIADTPADPFAYNGSACFKISGCNNYIGSCPDLKGKTNFSPPYSNMMSYWYNNPSTCTTTATVTSGQYSRVNATISTNNPLQNCLSPASITLSNLTVSSGYYISSAVTSVNTNGSIVLTGNAQATLAANTILLEPGFYAAPGSNGITRIIASSCN